MEATSTPTADTTTTTAAAPSAAPVSASPTPAERPTFAQAFASDAATSPEQPAQPEAPTTQAADATTTQAPVNPSADAKTGPIPFDVHKTALENARVKGAAEYREKYGWAESVPRESLERFSAIATSMTSDPVGFINQFISEVSQHPAHAAQLRSQAGRLLASARGAQAPAAPDLTPDVQIMDDAGRVVGTTFSAEKVKALLDHSVQEHLAPLQQERAQRQAERDQQLAQQQQAETTRQIEAKADEVMTEVMDIIGGEKAFLADVAAMMDANPSWSAHKAALAVRKTKIDPAAAGKAEASLLDSLKTKAAASTANPASAAVATAKRPKSFNDPALKWT